jgi:hypothetical protein
MTAEQEERLVVAFEEIAEALIMLSSCVEHRMTGDKVLRIDVTGVPGYSQEFPLFVQEVV